MDYPCANFGNFLLHPFWFYRADRITESQTESHTKADDRYTHATTVGVSKYRQCSKRCAI